MRWVDRITERSSWRSYAAEPLSPVHAEALRAAIAAMPSAPFGTPVRLQLVEGVSTEGKKLGTYGVIRGARAYLVGSVPHAEHDLEDFGWAMERLILEATALGLGTCWLGGTLDRAAFGQAVRLEPGSWIPAVSPVGPTAERRTLVDGVFRLFAGSRSRLAWERLFFDNDFASPLSPEQAGAWAPVLEGVRVGPSASNKQPWRVLLDGQGVHLYLQFTPGYASFLDFEIQRLDAGIAMCHLELAATEASLAGRWVQAEPDTPHLPGSRYVASWVV